jgi:hypothetical protein
MAGTRDAAAAAMTSASAWALATVLACGLNAACAQRAATRTSLPQQDEAALPQQGEGHKSYVLPVVEIVAMDVGINRAAAFCSSRRHSG